MGFLQSIFERFVPENIFIAEALERRGVTENGACRMAEMTTSLPSRPTAFIFNARSAAFCGKDDIAAGAFEYLQKKTNGRIYSSFELKNVAFDAGLADTLKAPAFSTEKVGMYDCFFSEKNLNTFFSGLKQTEAVALELENTPCTGCLSSLNVSEKLSDLSIKNARLNASDTTALTTILPHLALERLVLRETSPDASGLAALIGALPASVSVLNLADSPLNDGCVEALAAKMGELKNAKIIDLSNCGLSAKNVKKLADALSPSVRKFNLIGAELSDVSVNALLKSAKRPDSMLSETNILPRVTSVAHPDPRYFQPLGAELTLAECENRKKYINELAKEKAALIAEKTAAGKTAFLSAGVLAHRNGRAY